CRMRIAFWTPVTPARVSPSRISGDEAWRSTVESLRLPAMGYNRSAPMDPDEYARVVSLACHDLRTPLATVFGFSRTLARGDDLDERSARFIGMMGEAADQMAELLDELAVSARIAADRWEPALREIDTLALARTADAAVAVDGSGETVETEVEAVG